jgi:DNA-binding transcriptional MerR regulator
VPTSRSKVLENFSFGEVARLSGVKPRTLDHWAATGFLPPSIREAVGTGTRRAYSFSDIVAARVVRDLRSAGASLQGLRKVVKELRKGEFNQTFAEVRLIVSGNDVYLKNGQDLMSFLRYPGQVHFPITILDLEATIKAIRSEAEKTMRATSPEPMGRAINVKSAENAVVNSDTVRSNSVRRRPRQLSLAFTRDRSEAVDESSQPVRAEETGRAETIKPARRDVKKAREQFADRNRSVRRTS